MGNINAGRRKIPVEKQKNRLSKTRKDEHANKSVSVALGSAALGAAPLEVKSDTIAMAKWRELQKIYKGKPFVTSSDRSAVERYCFLCAEEKRLRLRLQDQIAANFDIRGILALNRSLDTKRSIIRSYEDRLFLNPLAKMRGLPPDPKPVNDALSLAGFEV